MLRVLTVGKRVQGRRDLRHLASPRQPVAEVSGQDQELLAAAVRVLREGAARGEGHQRRAPCDLRRG